MENNRIGKIRYLFKKTGDIEGIFHTRIVTKKEKMLRTSKQQKRIKRGGNNTQKNYIKTSLNEPDDHNSVVIHPELVILQCEVKWALGSMTTNKARGGDEIPAELFKILKDDAVKVLHSICQQVWKTQVWPKDQKRSVFIQILKNGNAKESSDYHTLGLNSHVSKVMLKIIQARP